MKQKQNASEGDSKLNAESGQEFTLFQQATDIQIELAESAGLPVDHLPARSGRELPKWSSKILEQFQKTILKPILKLKPNGTVNWRNYGKIIGIIERFKTFLVHDVEQIFIEEGFDKITDEQWERIRPQFGEEEARHHLVRVLERPVADSEPLGDLVAEAIERWFEHFEKSKSNALWHVAQQNAKATALFLKGMTEGYTCFLDENGGYVGDRGRTNMYLDFLAHRLEIEKYRRTMPVKTRRDLQQWIIEKAKIRIQNDDKWFDHFCDEICLSMKGVGRKPNPQVS